MKRQTHPGWLRLFTLLLLPLILTALAACSRGPGDCPPAPRLDPTVGDQALSRSQVSGNGTYCGAIGDGVSADSLDPVQARPGTEVLLRYQTGARWNTVTYGISDRGKTLRSGKLNARNLSFKLPDEPGTYYVGIQGESGHGQVNSYFQVIIDGEAR